MTIGIYSLYWPNTDQIYIGQSIDVERRWLAHSSAFKRDKHANPQMLSLYKKYGQPDYSIIQECNQDQLLALEVYWCGVFDNVLNIQEPGVQVGSGTKNPNSRYSRKKILRVFSYLYKYGYSQPKVSKLTNVPRGTISHIVHSVAHLWLKQEYPAQHAIMLYNAKNNLRSKLSN